MAHVDCESNVNLSRVREFSTDVLTVTTFVCATGLEGDRVYGWQASVTFAL